MTVPAFDRVARLVLAVVLLLPFAAHGATPESGTAAGAYLAGRAAANARDFDAAAGYLLRALADDPENAELLRRAFMAVAAEGRQEQTLQLAQRLVAREPTQSVANLVLAFDDVRGKRLDAAAARLAALPRSGLNNLVLPVVRAWIAAGQRDAEAARRALRPLAETTSFAQLHALHAGLIAEFLGDPTAAEESFKDVLENAPSQSYRAVSIIGGLYERIGKPAQAKTLYDTFQARTADHLLEPAYARLASGQAPPPQVATVEDGLAEALFDVATVIQRERPNGDLAVIYTRLALSLRTSFPIAQMLLAEVLEGQDRAEAAVAVYRAIAPDSPFHWSARLRSAQVRDGMGDTEGAIAELKAMAAERPAREDALARLGDLLRGKDRFEEAAQAYDGALARVLALERRHWLLLFNRAMAQERSGKWEAAEVDLLRALELEPDQPYVLNYLGYTWADRGLKLDRAKVMIERAVSLRPQDGHIVDSLGWLYYRQGEFDSAVRQLERAVELRPQDATINDHLGDAYWQAGRREEARFQWRRALSLDADPDVRSSAEKKLKDGLAPAPRTTAERPAQ